MMLKYNGSCFKELFSLITNSHELYMPIEAANQVGFSKWQPEANVRLDMLLTVTSPKNFFFRDVEDLSAFKLQGMSIEIKDTRRNIEDFVLFGVRACDAKSFQLLDKVFLSDPIDTVYNEARTKGIVITVSCSEPEETCFCKLFDIECTSPGGDISTWLFDESLYWKSNTEKGDRLTKQLQNIFVEADDNAVIQAKKTTEAVLKKLPFNKLRLEKISSLNTLSKFESDIWQKMHSSCISCSTCTFICPTCHCYDVQDFDTGKEIRRIRCWDSCMNADFTQMAHGNPRPTSLERFRQRYMHKLRYFPDNYDGDYACVGCGRCVRSCPVSMSIVKVINALEGDADV